MASRPRPTVRVVGTQRDRVLHGRTMPGAEIDAVNLSASAADRTGVHDAVMIARADARGRFAARLPLRSGDVLRVRARAGGAVGPWVLVRTKGVPGAPRPPQVALARIALLEHGCDSIRVFNLSRNRPIAAPGVTLVFTNERTGERIEIVTNDRGTISGRPRLGGCGGDVLRVETRSASGRARFVGTLVTPAPEARIERRRANLPKPCRDVERVGFVPALRLFHAPLFVRRPRAEDVHQSELENCYIASASAALAHVRPDCIARAIAPTGDGHYRVRLHAYRPGAPRPVARDVVVGPELYVRPSGELLYGSSERPVLWWPILEKAFAQIKGSYKALGEGGCADLILSALVGRPARRFFVYGKREGEADRVFSEIARALEARLPVCAGTWGGSARTFARTGLVPNHAYSVLSCRTLASGKRVVGVRNPWGEDAKRPCRPRKRGFLEVPIEEFVRLFCVVLTVR